MNFAFTIKICRFFILSQLQAICKFLQYYTINLNKKNDKNCAIPNEITQYYIFTFVLTADFI